MDLQLRSASLSDTLQHLCRHWEESRTTAGHLRHQPESCRFTIALSREAGIQGTSVAREVGARLGWTVYDHELLERIAQDMGVRSSLLESMDERQTSWLQEAFESFFSIPVVRKSAYIEHLAKTILALGTKGECVIVGRGAPHILPASTTLRVRLTAPLKARVAALCERLGISKEDAARQVEATDRQRNSFVQDYFQKNPTDPHNYDLILNFARFAVAGCAEITVTALHQMVAAEGAAVRSEGSPKVK